MKNTIRDLSELGRLDRTQSPKQAYIPLMTLPDWGYDAPYAGDQ